MSESWKEFGPIPLRLMMAAGFLFHGLPKVTPAGHTSFTAMLTGLGIPSPVEVAWLVGALEVIGALMLLAGYKVRLIVIPLMIEMVVAIYLVHWPSGFGVVNITGTGPNGPIFGRPGIEFNLLYLSALTALWFTGAGAGSIDYGSAPVEEIPREPGLRRREREPLGVD